MSVLDQIGMFLLGMVVLCVGAACFYGLHMLFIRLISPWFPNDPNAKHTDVDITSPMDFMDMGDF